MLLGAILGDLLLHGLGSLHGVLVGSEEAVTPCEVLSVVVLEVTMMDIVVASAVDDLPVGKGDAIVDGGGPNSHGDQEDQMRQLVHGDDVGAEPVRPALRPGIKGVEGEGGEGAGVDERVMQFVDRFVEQVGVQGIMNPVDAKVGNDEEEGNGEEPVRERERQIIEVIEVLVDFGVAHLERHVDGGIDERDHDHCHQRSPQFSANLSYHINMHQFVHTCLGLGSSPDAQNTLFSARAVNLLQPSPRLDLPSSNFFFLASAYRDRSFASVSVRGTPTAPPNHPLRGETGLERKRQPCANFVALPVALCLHAGETLSCCQLDDVLKMMYCVGCEIG